MPFPVKAEEEEEIPPVCDPESEEYDEDECKRLKALKAARATGDSMPVEWEETIALDSKSYKRSGDGYLVGESRAARSGIQKYRGYELGDSRDIIRVYRPPDEVFDVASLQSFAHKPLTLGHPPELVDADNWKRFAVGHLDGAAGREVAKDGEYVRVPWYLFDGDAIRAVESGKARELSVGYRADIRFEDGVAPNGEKYDAVQRGIRVNHLAIVSNARGGKNLRLGDENRRGSMAKIMCDGVSLTLPDADAVIVKNALEKKDGQIAALNRQLKDSELTPQQLDSRVAARASVIAKAQSILGEFAPAGLTDAEIKKQAVAKKLGEAVTKEMSDASVDGAFLALTANTPVSGIGGGGQDFARSLISATAMNDMAATRDSAWEQRGQIQRDARGGPQASSSPVKYNRNMKGV